MLTVLLLTQLLHITRAAVPSFGGCPNVRGKEHGPKGPKITLRKVKRIIQKRGFISSLGLETPPNGLEQRFTEMFSGMAGFDKSRYLGAWYEYANTFEIYQIGGICVRATYTDEGNNVGVFNEAINTM